MKNLLAILCVLLWFAISGAELTIAEKGKSDYEIVLPDGNNELSPFYAEAGRMISDSIRSANGTILPVIQESRRSPGKKAIFIGPVKALKDCMPSGYWEYRIKNQNGNIYLYGTDHLWNKIKRKKHDAFVLGSCKAAAVFAEHFIGAAVLLPGDKVSVLPRKKITVPADFQIQKKPYFQYNFSVSRSGGLWYDLYNSRLPHSWYASYGGHSHNFAILRDKYAKTHPEYFAMSHGKRLHPRLYSTQYCLSNPEVQKLILQNVIERLDQGFESAQLAQSDGFHWCECETCAKLFGESDSSEKLWILHRDIAVKVAKLRPGKKVCILAYGPTVYPPKTFDTFPENVIIELAPATEKQIAQWKRVKVPGGFSAYIYNWGWYQSSGFTPKMSFRQLQKQLQLFRKNNIRGIYTCGFGELPGLEGPAYFIWNKLQEDEQKQITDLLDFYCKRTFGMAADSAVQFYTLLDRQLQKTEDEVEDFTNPAMLRPEHQSKLICRRYPPEVMEQLEDYLKKMEINAGNLLSVRILRLEFDYLKTTVNALMAYRNFLDSRTDENFAELLDTLEKREHMIGELPHNQHSLGYLEGIRLFGGAKFTELLAGGRLYGKVSSPFCWDWRWMRQNQVKPAGRRIIPNNHPQMLFQQGLHPLSKEITSKPTIISCTADDRNFQIVFSMPEESEKQLMNNGFHVYFFRKNGGWRVGAGLSIKGPWSYLSRLEKTSAENNEKGNVFKQIHAPAYTVRTTSGKQGFTAKLTIPWKTVGGTPAPCEKIGFNAVRINKNTGIAYVWEQTQKQENYSNRLDEYGTLNMDR